MEISNLTINQITERNYSRCVARLLNTSFPTGEVNLEITPLNAASIICSNKKNIYGAFIDKDVEKQLVGVALYYPKEDDSNMSVANFFTTSFNGSNVKGLKVKKNNEVELVTLAVDVDYQHQGIATRLVRESITSVQRAYPEHKITTSCLSDLYEFYKNVGFVIERDMTPKGAKAELRAYEMRYDSKRAR